MATSSDKFEDTMDWEEKFKDKEVKMVDEIVSLNEQLRDVQRVNMTEKPWGERSII